MKYNWNLHRLRDSSPKGPHGWIQWNGTDVCIDLYCKCGRTSHVDADFFYFFKCKFCCRKYQVGQYIHLIEIPDEVEPDYGFISGDLFSEKP